MKYLQQGGFQNNPHMRLTLGLALVLLAFFWVTNAALYFAHMNLDPASVVAYYRGDEARFMSPRSAESMLEVTPCTCPCSRSCCCSSPTCSCSRRCTMQGRPR
jgi:hypothetical protein